MKRWTILILLAMGASECHARAMVGTYTASFVVDGKLQKEVTALVDGDRWRTETTYYGDRESDKGTLPEQWIETFHDGVYQYEAYGIVITHDAEGTKFGSTPYIIALYTGDLEVQHQDMTVYYTYIDTERPDPMSFAIRPDVVTVTSRSLSASLMGNGLTCSNQVQSHRAEPCDTDPGGCHCEGWFGYFYAVWICAPGDPQDDCWTSYVPRLSEIMCDHTGEGGCTCITKGDWYTHWMPGCDWDYW